MIDKTSQMWRINDHLYVIFTNLINRCDFTFKMISWEFSSVSFCLLSGKMTGLSVDDFDLWLTCEKVNLGLGLILKWVIK